MKFIQSLLEVDILNEKIIQVQIMISPIVNELNLQNKFTGTTLTGGKEGRNGVKYVENVALLKC